MKLFLSWSGEPAKAIALAMRDLIDMLCKGVEPWVSSTDIKRGARWGFELAKELSTTNVGIIVLTPYNLKSEWLLFEAGALSKSVEDGHVHPLLFGIDASRLPSPISQFQATVFRHAEVRDLLWALANSTEKPGSQSDLYRRFDEQWPVLEKKVRDALELGAALAIAEEVDAAAAVQRSRAKEESFTLEADHMATLEFLARANGVKQTTSSIADGLKQNYDRAALRVEQLLDRGYVLASRSPAAGMVYGLSMKGRELALQSNWI